MPGNNFTYLWVAMATTGMAMVIHYWHWVFTSKKEPMAPDEEDPIP